MTKTPRVGVWFTASAAIFFTRALLFSTWLSRGPEVQQALHLNTAQMGLLAMMYPAGGLLGIFFASSLANRVGSTKLTIGSYGLACAAMVALGYAIESNQPFVAAACLIFMGLPMAISDYVGNYEGTAVDKLSKNSLLPGIHAAFGVGMMVAAGFASLLISNGFGISVNYWIVAIVSFLPSLWAGWVFPRRAAVRQSHAAKVAHTKAFRKAWTEPRTQLIALIGFSFIMVESSAGTWMPIALHNSGFSQAAAASALGLFWVVVTAARAVGGWVTDRIGRAQTIGFGALLTAAGIAVFMLDPVLHLPYLGLAFWAVGMANGFPLSISSMSDDPAGAEARINLIITVVYISVISVGPALGSVGQAFGLTVAFGIPLVLILISAMLSRATKPLVLTKN